MAEGAGVGGITLTAVEWVYIGVVLAIGGLLLWRTLVFLGAIRRGRLHRLERRRRFESAPTGTPLDNPTEVAKERGVESIERHFTVMRRVLVPMIVGLTALLAALPILAESSAAAASIFGAVLAVVIGLAARPFLENAIAGIVISASRLVRIGDTVRVDGLYGTVEDITATHTAVKVWDWRRYLVPNSTMLQSAFLNHSLFDTFEWADVEFWVAPDADMETVKSFAVRAATESGLMVGDEPPFFWIQRLEKDAVCCAVAAWAATPSQAWALRSAVRERIMREMRERGMPTMRQRHAVEGDRAAPEVPSS